MVDSVIAFVACAGQRDGRERRDERDDGVYGVDYVDCEHRKQWRATYWRRFSISSSLKPNCRRMRNT